MRSSHTVDIVLTSTFIHAHGIGKATEQSLWEQGATTWDACLGNIASLKLGVLQRNALLSTVADSVKNLDGGCVAYFARALPKREHWRALSEFGDRTAFLDIETDGGYGPDSVTIIGLCDGFDFYRYVRGDNLTRFARDCRDFDAFVTFAGGSFDVPMLIRRFPDLGPFFAGKLHVDLCPLLRRLGYTGGLKRIEEELKIRRVPEAEGLTGFDAVRLWRIYARNGPEADDALRLLIAYNREDVVNLKMLLDFALPRLRDDAGWVNGRPS
jgi:uncharacterized protein YprB with RNaseH-like and TPR domain